MVIVYRATENAIIVQCWQFLESGVNNTFLLFVP